MSHNERNFAERIRALGYRMTPQRQLILDAICEMGGHAPISEVYARVHEKSKLVDKATVYRTVNMLHENGLLVSAEINGTTTYEIAEDHPHHHLVCRMCGDVTTLQGHQFDSIVTELREKHGFLAELNHLTINGVCKGCFEK